MLCVLPHCTLHQQSFSQLQTPLSMILYHQLGHWQKCDGQREATSSLCYFSTRLCLDFGQAGKEQSCNPSLSLLGLESDPRILGRQHHTRFLRQAKRSASLPDIPPPLTHTPTHSHSVYLSPQSTKQERNKKKKKLSLRQRGKSQVVVAREFCSAQRGARRGRGCGWDHTGGCKRLLHHLSHPGRAITTLPHTSPAGSETPNGLRLKRELFIYPAARCF